MPDIRPPQTEGYTCRPSRPSRADWLGPGQHITAVGSDLPGKQELDPRLFTRADKVVVDSVTQAVRSADVHHAIDAGLLSEGVGQVIGI